MKSLLVLLLLAASSVAEPLPSPKPVVGRPIYKQWWLWTGAAVVVAVGVGIGLSIGLAPASGEVEVAHIPLRRR